MSNKFRYTAVALAAGLLIPGVSLAGPQAPDSIKFVGDAAIRGTNQGQLDWARWGSSKGGADRFSSVQPRERQRLPVPLTPMTPTQIAAARKYLDDLAPPLDGPTQAQLNAARASTPPSVYNEDMHPFEFLLYVRSLPDKDAQFIVPPPNKIKVVDQTEIDRRLALPENKGKTAKDILDNFYKVKKTSIVTHTLTPILQSATVYYPG